MIEITVTECTTENSFQSLFDYRKFYYPHLSFSIKIK